MDKPGIVWNAVKDRRLELGPARERDGKRFGDWRLVEGDGTAWLFLDAEEHSVNTMNEKALTGLGDVLDELENNPPQVLVLRSAKPGNFCVGADVKEFKNLAEPEKVKTRLAEGHGIIDRLAALKSKTICIIHGHCLGAGLELALACDIRIAVKGAKLGFPEVRLGLHPGLGGTFRSIRLINPVEAMTLMLTGKTAYDRKAKSLGLVDALTEERHVLAAIHAAAEGRLKPHRQKLYEKLMLAGPVRRLIARRMRDKTREKAREDHYPAPFRLIDLWEDHGGNRKAMQKGEIASFAELITSEAAQNMIRVFFLREKLKKEASGKGEVKHLHVVGAGAMGGDIANWAARRGIRVTLNDARSEMIADALKRAQKLAKSEHLSGIETRDMLDRLIPDPDNLGIAHADLIIEAVPEKLEIKKKVYAAVEPHMKKGAVLATNTSSIPLESLREELNRPERLIGLHFFNPVARMQLVELVTHDAASKKSLELGRAFLGEIERLCIPVKSAPGFLVNRALMPYLMEATVMLEEGIAAETIDKAAERFGMPMGPIELADRVGLDVALDVAENLKDRLDAPFPDVPARFRKLVDENHYGMKTGCGFYTWEKGKPQKQDDSPQPTDEMQDRLVLPLLDACVTCLREEVVTDAELLDGAMIFATGFAPFTGGPVHYARGRGIEGVIKTLEDLADKHGERMKPDPGWTKFGKTP